MGGEDIVPNSANTALGRTVGWIYDTAALRRWPIAAIDKVVDAREAAAVLALVDVRAMLPRNVGDVLLSNCWALPIASGSRYWCASSAMLWWPSVPDAGCRCRCHQESELGFHCCCVTGLWL